MGCINVTYIYPKTQLQTARQELSRAPYQHDAARRVIAGLNKEVAKWMSAEVIQKVQDKATVLTQERKKRGRTVPEELITQDQIKTFLTTASHPVSCYLESSFVHFRIYIF